MISVVIIIINWLPCEIKVCIKLNVVFVILLLLLLLFIYLNMVFDMWVIG